MTNQVHTHPGQPNLQAEVILASRYRDSTATTMRIRCPRIIWPEILTHRAFSRNARSSRAVPAKVMLAEISSDPFVPWHWTKNEPGMQGQGGHDAPVWIPGNPFLSNAPDTQWAAWAVDSERAVDLARAFANAGYHKQVFNRLVEPFMWIDALITATEWDNFFHLRDHEDAEPHLQDLACLMRKAIDEDEVQTIRSGQWHMPYVTEAQKDQLGTVTAAKISAARCARISYAPFDGEASIDSELARYGRLTGGGRLHASPLEHVCTPAPYGKNKGNLRRFHQMRHKLPHFA